MSLLLRNIGKNIRDIFDANTEDDYARRQQQYGTRISYENEQKQVYGKQRPLTNFGQQVLGSTSRLANTGIMAKHGVKGLFDIGKESIFGTDQSYKSKLNQVDSELNSMLNNNKWGYFGAGTVFNGANDPALNGDAGAFAKKTVGTGFGVASEIGPLKAGKLFKTAPVVGKVAGRFGVGATEAALGNIGEQYVLEGKVNPKETAFTAVTGGTIANAPGAYRFIKSKSKNFNQVPLDQLTSYEGAPDRARVDFYKKKIQAGEKIEPLKIKPDSKGNLGIEDGKHRYQAFKEEGYKYVPVENKPLTNQRGAKYVHGPLDDDYQEPPKIQKVDKSLIESRVEQIKQRTMDKNQERFGQYEPGPDELAAMNRNADLDVGPTVKMAEETKPKVALKKDFIDVATGEVNPKKPSFVQQYEQDLSDLTPEQKVQTIDNLRGTWNEGIDALEASVQQKTGRSFDEFAKVLQDNSRNGTPIPDWAKGAKAEYDATIASLRKILPEGTGDVTADGKSYMPQTRVLEGNPDVPSGSSLISDIDSEFNFGKTRTNSIPLEELDYSANPLRRLGDQLINQKLKNPDQVALAKDIAKLADEGGVVSSSSDKFDVVDKLSKLGDSKGKPKNVVNPAISWAKRIFSSSSELYDGVKMADGRTLSESIGFDRYTDASALAHTINEMGDDVGATLRARYSDVPIDPDNKENIILAIERRLAKIDKDEVLTPEEKVASREFAIAQVERNIAREQLVETLESNAFANEQLKKNLNHDANRMLTQDRANQSIAEHLVNGFTGVTYTGALGYNPLSAFQNITENKRAYSLFSLEEAASATKRAVTDGDITHRYGITETKVGDVLEKSGPAANPKGWKPMGMFQKAEKFKDATLLHGLESKYKGKGLTGTALTEAVLKDFKKYAIKYGQAGSLGFNKSKLGRLIGQFMQFTIKDLRITASKVGEAVGRDGADDATKVAAQKYLAKLGAQNVAIYLAMSSAIGTSWEYVFGVQNPVQGYDKKDASIGEKVVRRIPGGPAVDMFKDLYLAIAEESRLAKSEGRDMQLGGVVNNSLKRDAALFVPGGNQLLNKTGGFIADQDRGYNENIEGRARFASAKDPLNIAKGLVFGRYATDEAREYFGSSGMAGDLPGRGGEQKFPVGQNFQKKINDNKSDTQETSRLIDVSREQQKERTDFFKANPTLKGVYDEMVKTNLNPKTGKRENDVLSPEKWKHVSSDKSLKLFGFLKSKQMANAKEFGYQVDPVYELQDPQRVKEVLELRSRPTGDDIEREEILRATTEWYPKFETAERGYYEKLDIKEDPDSEFALSDRKKEWISLKADQPALVKQYYQLKEKDPEAAKNLFKTTNLSAEFDTYTADRLKVINAKRKLEGFPPIDADTFNNVTFGYEDDERKVFNSLKYGKGFGGFGKKGDKSVGSAYKYAVSLNAGGKAPSPKVSIKPTNAPKTKATKIAKPKVSIKKSKV